MFALLATFAVFFGGSLVPAVCAEVYLLAAAALAPPALLPGLVLAATAGQVLGKSLLYLAGRRAAATGRVGRRLAAKRGAIARIETLLRTHPRWSDALIGLSGFAGIPPLYALSIACGALRTGIARFVCAAGAGRLLRHGLLVALPSLVR